MNQESTKTPIEPGVKENLFKEEVFNEFVSQRSWEPGWLAERRKDAWEKFKSLDSIQRKDERWRFSPKNRFSLSEFCLNNRKDPLFEESIEVPSGDWREEGITCSSLNETLLKDHMAAIELSNCNGPNLGADAAQFLSEAYMDNGIIIRAPKGVSVQEPLTINHQAPPSGQIAFHKTLIILEEGASITIRENFNSRNQNDRSAICSSTNILASQNSQLNRILIQNLNTRSSFFQLDSSEANKSSRVKNCSLHLGSSQSRSESLAVISGEDAEIEILGLSIGTGEQLFDQRTRQLHIAPAGNSKLLYKNALLEESKAVFSGLIKVDEKAQGTNAYQTNRNLLLSPKAEADSLPELEILANEVKCSHGATTGEIDKEQLYYLRSRGIEKSAAEELLVFGFIEEVLESLKNEELVESLRTQVRQKFK